MSIPSKKKGETFGQYFARISFESAAHFAVVAKATGVTPQSFFATYIEVGDGHEDPPSVPDIEVLKGLAEQREAWRKKKESDG